MKYLMILFTSLVLSTTVLAQSWKPTWETKDPQILPIENELSTRKTTFNTFKRTNPYIGGKFARRYASKTIRARSTVFPLNVCPYPYQLPAWTKTCHKPYYVVFRRVNSNWKYYDTYRTYNSAKRATSYCSNYSKFGKRFKIFKGGK